MGLAGVKRNRRGFCFAREQGFGVNGVARAIGESIVNGLPSVEPDCLV